jgi:hypothetical protein
MRKWRISMSKLKHFSIYHKEGKWKIWRIFYPLLSHKFLKVSLTFSPPWFCTFIILLIQKFGSLECFILPPSLFQFFKTLIKIRSTNKQQFESFKICMLQIYNECNKFLKMFHHLILPPLILMEFGRIICFSSFYQNSYFTYLYIERLKNGLRFLCLLLLKNLSSSF